MNETNWLSCGEPAPMLDFLRGKFCDRKLRLFACACCHRVLAVEQQLPSDLRLQLVQPPAPDEYRADIEFFHRAVKVSEDTAEGKWDNERAAIDDWFRRHPVTGCPAGYDLCHAAKPNWTPIAAFEFIALTAASAFQEPLDAFAAAQFSSLALASMVFLVTGPDVASRQIEENMAELDDPQTVYECTFRYQLHEGDNNSRWVADTEVEGANGYAVLAAYTKAQAKACDILRDVFDNPFRITLLDPSWLKWQDGTVRNIAQAIYDARTFDRMPILGDALEDAGCDDPEILRHCRESCEHVRGCWVIDLLLGKE
jgi:hypothetical protein